MLVFECPKYVEQNAVNLDVLDFFFFSRNAEPRPEVGYDCVSFGAML